MTQKFEIQLLKPRYWPIWLALGLLRLITLLPLRWQFCLGKWLGMGLECLSTKGRRTAEVNLKLCFPELSPEARNQLLHDNYISVGIAIIETGLGLWAPDHKLKNLVSINGLENVSQALAHKKGLIFCCAHFTTLEIIGRLFAQEVKLAVMYRPQKNPVLEYVVKNALEKHYRYVIARDDIRGMLKCLKNNIPIFYTPDVDAGTKNSIFAPFFGIQTASITATPRYAKMSGAPVMPSFFYRRKNEIFYDIYLYPVLDNFPSDDLALDVARINLAIEKAIRECPEQYLWQYKRFKTRPQGEKRFY